MPDKTHILVISQYFYPEQFRINDICTEWVKRGYQVTVVTGIPNYPQGKFYEGYGYFTKRTEKYNNIDIIRLPLVPRGNGSFMMAMNYLSFVISGFLWKTFTSIDASSVFVYEVSPMTQALPGVWYAKRKNIPCFLYVTDLWPENVEIVGGVKNKFILGLIGRMVDYIYANSKIIFTSSKSFIRAITARGVASNKLKFWPQYAEEFYKPLDICATTTNEIVHDGVFNITFAGNIGFAQGLDILPQVAQILAETGRNVRFNIIGNGRFLPLLKKTIAELNVEGMFNFISRQPAIIIPEYMAHSDAALISLSNSVIFAMTLPAKLQSCLACGIPLLVSANGEIQTVINESGAGLCCDSGDAEQLANIITELISLPTGELKRMGENGYKYFVSHYEKSKLLDEMDKYLDIAEVA